MESMKIYLASGWFNPVQAEELTNLESIFDSRSDYFELASPRRIFVCPPGAPKEVQDENLKNKILGFLNIYTIKLI